MGNPEASKKIFLIVDSREASISYAVEYLKANNKKVIEVMHSRKSSIADAIGKILTRKIPSMELVLSVTLLDAMQLQVIHDLLKTKNKKCILLSYNKKEDLTSFQTVIEFEGNTLQARPGYAAGGKNDLRNWRQYRLMKLVISRTPLTDTYLKELVEATKIPDEDKRPTENYVKLGEPDMAGGTYSNETDDGNLIDRLRNEITRMAAADFPVMIVGESGTGKEAAAWSIHELGNRRTKTYCTVNCAGFSEELAESVLFGHKKGAFTGADNDKAGLFKEADGGTLFLDEFPNLSPSVQTKLLRCCETGEILPLGESTPSYVDVRIIAAAQPGRLYKNKKTKELRKNIREDLVARLNALTLHIPTLRSMEKRSPGSIAKVARVLLERLTWTTYLGDKPTDRKKYTPADIEKLMQVLNAKYVPVFSHLKWKGVNIRGLYNSIIQWLVMGEDYLDAQLQDLQRPQRATEEEALQKDEIYTTPHERMMAFVRFFPEKELPRIGSKQKTNEHFLSYYIKAVQEVYSNRTGSQYQTLIGLSPPAISKYAGLAIKNTASYAVMRQMVQNVDVGSILLANNSYKNNPKKNIIALYVLAVKGVYENLGNEKYAALLGVTRETFVKYV